MFRKKALVMVSSILRAKIAWITPAKKNQVKKKARTNITKAKTRINKKAKERRRVLGSAFIPNDSCNFSILIRTSLFLSFF